MVGSPNAVTSGDLPAPLLGTATADAMLKNGWRLQATDPRLNSQVGRAEGRSIVTDGRAGFLLFGPYAIVPSGCWKASVTGSFIPGAGCVRIDVVSGTGRFVHAAIELTAPAERADLEFQIDRTAHDLEIRVWAHESATARIDTVALEGIADTGQHRLATDHDRRTFSITTGGRDDGIDESRVAQVRKAEAPTDSAADEAATTANRDRDGDERAAGAAPRRPATVRDPARLREADGLDERVLHPAAGDGKASHRPGERIGGAGPHDAREGVAPGRHGPVPEGGLTSRAGPTFSIVIATDGRAAALAELLGTLPFLEGPPFEVCLVRGPTEDGISSMLDGWRGRIKTACNPVRNLSLSRNIGIAMAAGEIVAFLDDDAIPEADWLMHLAEAFADPAVACAGGVNRDKSGVGLQYGYATANRMGQARWDRTRPADELCAPGAPEFPYTQGTNTAIRRADLEALGGFDEEYEFYLDETDLCCRLVDAGRLVRQLPRAFVHHRSLPSAIRTAEGVTHSLFSVLKNKLYFSLVNNRGHHTVAEALADYDAFVSIQERHLTRMAATSPDGPRWLERFAGDTDRACTTGLARGHSGLRLLMSPGLIDEHRRPFLPLVRRPAADHVACQIHRQRVVATGTPITTTSPADHVRSQREILHRTWGEQVPRGSRIAIACDHADGHDHWSVEDAAAWRGMRSLLPALGVEVGYACDRWSYGPERLARAVPRGPILVLGGGPHDDAHGLLGRIRADFPDRTIIQAPRHIGACDPDSRIAIAALLGTRCQATLLLRDTQSLARARTQLLARSLLCPDATLALDLADVPRVGDVPVVALWRTDVATALPLPPLPRGSIITDWLEPATATSPGSLRSRALRAASGATSPANRAHAFVRRVAWRVLPLLWDSLAEERLLVNCRLLARGRVVITNRLHGHLLCLLLGIPHVICDTVPGDLITSSPTWPQLDPFTRVAATPAEAVAIAVGLAGTAAPARSRAA